MTAVQHNGAVELRITDYQRKRLAKGYSIPILKEGNWYKISCKNKNRVDKIKKKIAELRLQLTKERGSKG